MDVPDFRYADIQKICNCVKYTNIDTMLNEKYNG